MKLWAFVRYWRRHYVYQRRQLGASPWVSLWDAFCDASWIWQSRKKHGL